MFAAKLWVAMRAWLRRSLLAVGHLCEAGGRRIGSMAIGLTRLSDLRAGNEHTWKDFHTTQVAIDQGFVQWEQEFVDRFVKPGDRVLVVGSGTGRDVVPLARMGCEVVGVEPLTAATATARRTAAEHGLAVTIINGYIEDVALSGLFHAIIVSCFCYGYIPGRQRRIEVLKKMRAHLTRGGRILLSYVRWPDPPARLPWAKAVGRWCRSDWQVEDGDVVFPHRNSPGLFNYDHVFTNDEITEEIASADLQICSRQDVRSQSVLVLAALDMT
jgi:SAM-dependent methyltransferase